MIPMYALMLRSQYVLSMYLKNVNSHHFLCALRPRKKWTGTLRNALPVPVFRCIFNLHLLTALFFL